MASYRDLKAWQKSMDLVTTIYQLTQHFPKDEAFGLTGQIRRAVVSIPSNIAEGHGRTHKKEYLHFLATARGSLTEAETQLIIAVNLGYLTREQVKPAWDRAQETGKLINGLMRALRQQSDASGQESDTADPDS